MANTYTSLHYHVIFSTKDREPFIRKDAEERIWSYLGGIARVNQIKPLLIGGIENHVHLLLGVPSILALSKAVQLIKGGSSKWIRETLPKMASFGWQDGYAAIHRQQVSGSGCGKLIRTQREHHRQSSFENTAPSWIDTKFRMMNGTF